MQQAPGAVLVDSEQTSETARRDFERLVSQVSMGEVKGVVYARPPQSEDAERDSNRTIRRGAVRGAVGGFFLGLVPLVGMTVMGAGAGALIARATQIRIEKGTAPRIHFASRRPDDGGKAAAQSRF